MWINFRYSHWFEPIIACVIGTAIVVTLGSLGLLPQ